MSNRPQRTRIHILDDVDYAVIVDAIEAATLRLARDAREAEALGQTDRVTGIRRDWTGLANALQRLDDAQPQEIPA